MATRTASAAGGAWNTTAAWVEAVVPTAADDVVFNSSSGAVNIPSGYTALCRSCDFTNGGTLPYTGTFTFASTTSNLNVGDASGGSLKFSSVMTLTFTGIGTINFLASTASTTYQLTTAGKTMPNLTVNVGTTTTIQLADAVTATGATITLTQGKFDTQSFAVTCGSFSSSNSNTRTLTLGSSAITLTAGGVNSFDVTTATNLTITANTATLTFNNGGGRIGVPSAGINLNGASAVFTGSGNAIINGTGTLTLANLTRTGSAVKTDTMQFGGNCTITGTFTVTSQSAINRVQVLASGAAGSTRTITAAAVVITNTVDFMDITGAGAATWTVAGTGATALGDCGGNSGITFTTPATQTHTASAGGNWSDVTKWTSRVPLPQDNVVIDVNTTGTLTADMPRLGASIDFTGFAGTASFSSITNTSFGNWTFSSGMTVSGIQSITLSGRGSQTITSAGKSFTGTLSINAPNGTYTLQDALAGNRSAGGASFLGLSGGTLVDNGFSVTSSGTDAQFTMTGGTLTKTGAWSIATTTARNIWSVTGGTVTDTGSIIISAASTNARTFAGGGKTYGTLTYTVAGSTGGLTITGANTFATINFSDATNARTLTLPASTTTTISSAFNVNGTAGKLMTVNSSINGTAATVKNITSPQTAFLSDYLTVQDVTGQSSSGGSGTGLWYMGGHSTNVSGNTGLLFSTGTILGQATGSSTPNALSNTKQKTLGQATGTNAANALSASKSKTTGQASTSATAQALSKAKSEILGQAAGSSVAGALGSSKRSTTGQASGTSSAQPCSAAKRLTLAQAVSLDLAQVLSESRSATCGQAVTAALAQALVATKSLVAGQASETSIAQALTIISIILRDLQLKFLDGYYFTLGEAKDRLVFSDSGDRVAFGQAADRLTLDPASGPYFP